MFGVGYLLSSSDSYIVGVLCNYVDPKVSEFYFNIMVSKDKETELHQKWGLIHKTSDSYGEEKIMKSIRKLTPLAKPGYEDGEKMMIKIMEKLDRSRSGDKENVLGFVKELIPRIYDFESSKLQV